MKEIIALHENILALALDALSEEGVDFSRDVVSDNAALLPADLQEEIGSLQQAINAALPDDFDYFVFVAFPDLPASFNLEYEQMSADGSEDGLFQADRPLVEQLPAVNWEEQRTKAAKFQEALDGVIQMEERASAPLRSAKALQREFREETKEFIKEKRGDAGRIHVLYWDDEQEMMEAEFDDGTALREALPNLIAQGSEVVTIVAGGKPLPVERIDALKSEAQRILREQIAATFESAGEEETGE